MLNLHTKFEVSMFNHYEKTKGNAKCRNLGGLGVRVTRDRQQCQCMVIASVSVRVVIAAGVGLHVRVDVCFDFLVAVAFQLQAGAITTGPSATVSPKAPVSQQIWHGIIL